MTPHTGANSRPRESQDAPDAVVPAHAITAEGIRAIVGAATPHFALQLRDRVVELIAGLDPSDPARIEGERAIARLERMAREGQASGIYQEGEQPLPSLRLDGGEPPC
jgi:hypothetical protein